MSSAVEKPKTGKKPKTTTKKATDAAHPPSSVMVVKAIEGLGEKKGSSLASIKKYIGANYKVDLAKMNVFIRKALKAGVEKKSIVASSGMSGRFKINKTSESKPKTAKPKAAKKATPKKAAKKPSKKATPKKAEKTKSAKKTAKKPFFLILIFLKIQGPCCQISCCQDVEFKVLTLFGDQQIGKMTL